LKQVFKGEEKDRAEQCETVDAVTKRGRADPRRMIKTEAKKPSFRVF